MNERINMETITTELALRKVPELNMEIVKKYICPKATDQEAFTFLQLCKAQNLNPFLKEAYLVKYGDEAATIITGKDTFTKRADRLPQYDGFKAGVIVLSSGKVIHREGSFFVNGEELLGGWAEVFRKDRNQSFRNEVSLKEYERRKKDGSLMSNWKVMPGTMIRKVALVQSLREAFPDEFGGMYSPEEMPIDASTLPTYSISEAPIYPPPKAEPIGLKQPEKKKADTVGTLTAETAIYDTKVIKEGESKGKPYKLYGVTGEGGIVYRTFSDSQIDIATTAFQKGQLVKISYLEGQYGNNITELEIIEGREPGENG